MVCRLVFMGPPGAGKGTQAKLLAERKGIAHLSTGELLRGAIKSRSEIGQRAKDAVEQGLLVPDEVLYGIVEEQLRALGLDKGFILDGFPRNVSQAEFLDGLLTRMGVTLDGAVAMRIPSALLMERLSGRRVCEVCSKEYHTEFSPSARAGVCDACGGRLYQREDDSPESIAKRLEVYESETMPILDFYEAKKLLRDVVADGGIEEVRERIEAVVCRIKDDD
ncbi:adenylate kinase [bacterium]|nr:adenylate kinase [bacterium]